jgi:hypothetical protein
VRVDRGRWNPVAQALSITPTPTKPAVIQNKALDTQFGRSPNQIIETSGVMVEVSGFP